MKPSKRDEDILAKYTERLATHRAVEIDNFIQDYIPVWQVKVIKALPFTKKLFGWEIRSTSDWIKPGTRIELLRYGQNVADLRILEKWRSKYEQT